MVVASGTNSSDYETIAHPLLGGYTSMNNALCIYHPNKTDERHSVPA
jgi:hypothetical protein